MGKNTAPSSEEVQEKLEAFRKQIETSAVSSKERASPTQDFLKEIKEAVKEAIDNDVSYAQICRDIKTIYSFKVSTQTLRAFAQNTLGVKPRQKKSRDSSAEPVKNEVFVDEKTPPKKMPNSDGIKKEKERF